MGDDTVYLNGSFLPLSEARVSVLDRGFIFGDGVYEVIPCYGRRPFRLTEHLARLQRSLDGIRLANPLDSTAWEKLLLELIERSDARDQALYLQVTRGTASREHGFPADTPPTVFAMSNPLHPPPPQLLEQGVAAITLDDIRWRYCHIKAISLLPNVLLRQQALDAGAQEAILLREGIATEGAASNLFLVDEESSVVTPPKDNRLLPGITRDLVVELARDAGLTCLEQEITEARLRHAREIWLTSSTREILPVTRLDGAAVGDGKPGAVWRQVYRHYQQYKQQLRAG
ncbi:MAG TPA: D-amino acid aminotransferase [Gammaproteobacteria bacterium]|nr:D-amino acid aminotransferase [Gammaproteobacteria bacterium]